MARGGVPEAQHIDDRPSRTTAAQHRKEDIDGYPDLDRADAPARAYAGA